MAIPTCFVYVQLSHTRENSSAAKFTRTSAIGVIYTHNCRKFMFLSKYLTKPFSLLSYNISNISCNISYNISCNTVKFQFNFKQLRKEVSKFFHAPVINHHPTEEEVFQKRFIRC